MDRLIQTSEGDVKQLMILPAMTVAQQLTDDPSLLGFNMQSAKLEALVEMIKNSLTDEKILIHSKFRTMIDKIEARLKKEGLDPVRVTGKESDDQRNTSKLRFMSDGEDKSNIILITKAGAKAINLQKGGHLFFYDMPWSYGLYRQIIGRLRRTGSVHKFIGAYRMLAVLHPDVAAMMGSEETIDQYSLNIVLRKFKLWQAVTGDAKEIDSAVSDMDEIFNEVKAHWRNRNAQPA